MMMVMMMVVMVITEIGPWHDSEVAVMMVVMVMMVMMMVMIIELNQLHWPLRRSGGEPGIIGLQRVYCVWNRLQQITVTGRRCGLGRRGCRRLHALHCSERRSGTKKSSKFLIHGVVPRC